MHGLPTPMGGEFITFEGGEGSGKSTQVKLLGEAFAAAKLPYLITREPGGTPTAERIREVLVSGNHDFNPMSETLLFYAARLEHVKKLIKPALVERKTVLCDRFADSTKVYQGVGKGMSEDFIRRLHHLTLGDFEPNLTIILDIDPVIGLKRAADRKNTETKFEGLPLNFHQEVRAGFLEIAKNNAGRCVVIDASQTPEIMQAQIVTELKKRFRINLWQS